MRGQRFAGTSRRWPERGRVEQPRVLAQMARVRSRRTDAVRCAINLTPPHVLQQSGQAFRISLTARYRDHRDKSRRYLFRELLRWDPVRATGCREGFLQVDLYD
jgi:hypothetical protein